ncbi:S8 family serine peptidase [Leptolyngbya sp. FACHB-261]|uniref:S8 family peptidase n=1 Tax=Leptolyngbya sp. FACHB-261 TaxID=2692806 RepID=UPI0016866F1F|nr:S8 family serine peptidase [Leptolyngbya sp. FACHB-261]MBD2102311.1 S8 family serine peptidase [Leptolyngbya sp. FACHB-261]
MKILKLPYPIAAAALATTTAVAGFCLDAKAATFNGSSNFADLISLLGSTKQGPMARVGTDLSSLYVRHTNGLPVLPSSSLQLYGDQVRINAIAAGSTQTLFADLNNLGLQGGSTYGSLVSGLLPVASIDDLAQLNSLQFARPTYRPISNVGLVTGQADIAVRADVARERFGVDGSGVKVGILSDSFDFLGGAATDVATGDLPPDVEVLKELPLDDPFGGIDEGRAMAQLIYDLAPGADLAFHTAFLGAADFAQGILDLAAAGSDIIVDDIGYLEEPFFQDGVIAQAVDEVVADGVAYFSAAGNDARNSYESPFNASGLVDPLFGELHDFDPTAGIDTLQSITIPEGNSIVLSFQWDQPFASLGSEGSASDLDILLFDESGTNLLAGSTESNIGADPLEIFEFENDGSFGSDQFNLAITNLTGPNPGLMKYILFGLRGSINEFDTASGTVFGHPNAEGAEAVGAAPYFLTPEFGVNPPILEPFSSAGSVPILFDSEGNRLAQPEIRLKPEIVAPDAVNNTFFPPFPGSDLEGDGFPNFFGTSAAAPNAAAVAALVLEANPDLSPQELYRILERTAIDMDDPSTPGFDRGFDFASGFGLIQADRAVAAATSVPEPTTSFGLLALALGAGSALKRKGKVAPSR